MILPEKRLELFTKDCVDFAVDITRSHPVIGLTREGNVVATPGTYFPEVGRVARLSSTGQGFKALTSKGKVVFWSGYPEIRPPEEVASQNHRPHQ